MQISRDITVSLAIGAEPGDHDDNSAWIEIGGGARDQEVDVTVTGGTRGNYGGRAGGGTFLVKLNPGHFVGQHAIDDNAEVRLTAVVEEVSDGGRRQPEFMLKFTLSVSSALSTEEPRTANIAFNQEGCTGGAVPPAPGGDQGGCDKKFATGSRCSNSPTEAWGGQYGVLPYDKCGAAPVSKAGCYAGDKQAQCQANYVKILAANCRQCCMEEAGRRRGSQGCCQFIWYVNAPSSCTWKAGFSEITPAEANQRTSPDQYMALTCDLRSDSGY